MTDAESIREDTPAPPSREESGTDLYRSIVEYDYGTGARGELKRRIWEPTPWVVDVWTGPGHPDPLHDEIRRWCHDTYGPESLPIHDQAGTWHESGVTINGWTWYGFATEEQMLEFVKAWPSRPGGTRE